jgi:DNA-binding FadR family transcriptional regulator
VLDRIAAHDADGARAAMANHLEGVAAWWRDHIAETPTA